MKNKAFILMLAVLMAQGSAYGQTSTDMTVPYGSFEQWTSHSGYSVTAGFIPLTVYSSYTTPTGWDYLTYPVNESFSIGITITVNTNLPLIKASKETGSVPNGSSAVKLQTFKLSDIISATVYSLASGAIDPELTSEVFPSILSTGQVDIDHFIPIMNSLMSNLNNTPALLASLAALDINYIVSGGLALGSFEPTYLSGSYKYHSATNGDNGGVVMLGTRYNSTTHRREVVGGGANTALTDCNGYTPFEVEYMSLHEYDASYAEQTPDSLIILLISSAGTSRQQGSYLCLDNLTLWHVEPPEPDTCASITALQASADIHEAVIIWSTTAAVDGFELEYGTAGFAEGQGTSISTSNNSITISGLEAETQYDVHVRSACQNGAHSEWASVSFTTLPDTCASITALQATAYIHEAVISWSATAAVDGFELEYGTAGFAEGQGTSISTTNNSVTINGLEAETQYDVHVRSACQNDAHSEWASVSLTTLPDTCASITALQATADIHEALVTWSTTAAVDGFELEYGTAGFAEGQGTNINTTNNSVTISGLLAETQYDMYVRSACQNGAHSEWASVSFTTLPDTCASITALQATADIHEALVTWSTTAAVDGFELEYGTAGFAEGQGTSVSTSNNSIIINGLLAETQYDVHVRSACQNGAHSEWASVSFTTLPDTCASITALQATAYIHEAMITWSTTAAVDGFELEYGTAGFAEGQGTSVSIEGNSITISGLLAETLYDMHVRSACQNGAHSEWASVSFTTLPDTCGGITALEATAEIHEAVISWSTSAAVDGFELEYGTAGFAEGQGTSISTENNSVTISGLEAGTQYDVHVRSACQNGAHSGWASVSFTTLPDTCGGITALQATAEIHEAVISWSTSAAVDGFELEYGTAGFAEGQGTSLSTEDNIVTISGLLAETQYDVHVRSACQNGAHSEWASVSFTTLPDTCGGITALQATADIHEAIISWSTMAAVDGFELEYGTAGFAEGQGTNINTTNNSVTISGLEAGTQYDVHVRSACQNGAHSEWASVNFTTLPDTTNVSIYNTASGDNTIDIKVYPNPAHGHCDVILPTGCEGEIRLYTCDGRLIQSVQGSTTLQLPAIGVYMLQAVTREGTAVRKIVNR